MCKREVSTIDVFAGACFQRSIEWCRALTHTLGSIVYKRQDLVASLATLEDNTIVVEIEREVGRSKAGIPCHDHNIIGSE